MTYSPWKDRPDEGQARPTEERLKRGDFHLYDTDVAGRKVARDRHATRLDKWFEDGRITIGQRDAGIKFIELHRSASAGAGYSRSCIDMSPRGSGGDPTEAEVARREAYTIASRKIGMIAESVFLSVVVWETHRVSNYERQPWPRIKEALEVLALHWGLEAPE